jgi:NADH-quinone oxidoreductase subunit C
MSPPEPTLRELVAGAAASAVWSEEFGTVKVRVSRSDWVEAHRALKSRLPFYSWLSAVDWVAEPGGASEEEEEGEEIEERFEVLSRISDVSEGGGLVLSADLPKDDARIDSLTGVYAGADWHEREAAEMFGIDFVGHPNLVGLYLPDGFEGHPLRKSYPLLSREIKPWPGDVEVEPLGGGGR